MVERRLLTTSFVNAAIPPKNGERWISDTKLRGFGLRLWGSIRGEGKAFAIRTTDRKGRSIRRTYDAEARNEYFFGFDKRPSLGDVLDKAREWAKDELCHAKGRPTLREEKDNHRRRFERRLSKLTLNDLVQARFRGMEIRGLTEQYVDTLKKLYHQHVPLRVQQTRISRIRPRMLEKVYRPLSGKPGSARTLHAFLGQIIKDVGFHSMPLYRAFYFADHFPAPARREHRYGDAIFVPKETFERIFKSLSEVQTDWLQAQFIRLLFEFNVPADRLMKAEWDHIADGRWYPWLQNERKYWWMNTRLIDDTIAPLLENLRTRTREEFADSPFLFPSRVSSTGHIRTFQAVWQRVACDCGVESNDFFGLIRSYHWSIVLWRRRLAYRARNYGNFVQGLSHSSE
jgi:hypothetical protein